MRQVDLHIETPHLQHPWAYANGEAGEYMEMVNPLHANT